MKLQYDIFNRAEPSRISLARTGKRLLGELNGVVEESCNCTINLNNTATIEFDVDRIVDGNISNWYDQIQQHNELFVKGVGWFKINEEPEIYNDGKTETKTVRAESLEIELQQYDLFGFRVNCASEDSWEMMAPDNLYDAGDGYMIPRESVKFYRDLSSYENIVSEFNDTSRTYSSFKTLLNKYPQVVSSPRIEFDLSTVKNAIQLVINELSASGHITSVLQDLYNKKDLSQQDLKSVVKYYPNLVVYSDFNIDLSGGDVTYTYTDVLERELERQQCLSLMWLVLHEHGWQMGYIDDSISADIPIPLSDMIGKFEIDSQDIYSFLTQNVASYFRCMFLFDSSTYTINAYKIESLGDDTNICLNFRNIQNDVTVNSDKRIYTVFHVSNSDNLNIREANIGSDAIEDISFFLNTDNFTQEFIDKYNAWKNYFESQRQPYMDASIAYRNQSDKVADIYYRVPVDYVDTSQYATLKDDELLEYKSNLEAQKRGYESYYVDANNDFDINALKNSSDWVTYQLITEIILPNIEIEFYNRGLDSKDDYLDFKDDYLFNFQKYGDAYGLKELEVHALTLKNNMDLLDKQGFSKPSENDDPYHNVQYEMYVKYKNGYESCNAVIAIRQVEYDEANNELKEIQKLRTDIQQSVQKTNSMFGFTVKELWLLDKYYIHTDYINENIVTTSIMTNEELVQQSYELYVDAKEQLSANSQPQWSYQTTQDNLLLMPEFNGWHRDLDIGNFIRIELRDDYQIKLRVSSINFNPYLIDTSIGIEFTSMIQYAAKRNDFVELLDRDGTTAKNQIVSNLTSRKQDDNDFVVDANLVRKLINNSVFSNYVGAVVGGATGNISGISATIENIVASKIDAIEINVDKIKGDSAEFEEFFAKFLEAENGVFNTLAANVANINTVLAGSEGVGSLQAIHLTSSNAFIDDALIQNAIINKLSVADLATHNVTTDGVITLIAQDGKPTIAFAGSTQQFYDADGNVRVQIGQASNGDFNFIIRGEDGYTALFDENGITKNGIGDELIVNDMIQKGTIDTDRLAFQVETDEDGNIVTSIDHIYMGDGGTFGAEYTDFKEMVTTSISDVQSNTIATWDVLYGVSESPDVQPTEWTKTPIWNENTYTWQKTVTTKGDSSPVESIVCIQGAKGQKGDDGTSVTILGTFDNENELPLTGNKNGDCYLVDGNLHVWDGSKWNNVGAIKGDKGDDGNKIESVTALYAKNTNKATAPDDESFSNSRPDWSKGEYLWTRLMIVYGNPYKIEYTVPICDTTWEAVDHLRTEVMQEIETITSSISGVSSTVNDINKSITDKVWQSDITTSINTYDGSTGKAIRDRITQTETDISGITSTVSDLQTEVGDKADGSTVSTLSNQYSELLQSVNQFKIDVGNTYVSNSTYGTLAEQVTNLSNSILEITPEHIISTVTSSESYKNDLDSKLSTVNLISTINQSATKIALSAIDIDMSGFVTFSDLSTAGKTTINGSNITTGTIDASKATIANIDAASINTGVLSVDRIADGTIQVGHLSLEAKETIVQETVDHIEIGSVNLIRNSETCDYADYYFVSSDGDNTAVVGTAIVGRSTFYGTNTIITADILNVIEQSNENTKNTILSIESTMGV